MSSGRAVAPGARPRRTQIHPYLPPEIGKRLRAYAAGKGSSQGSVIETALTRYFDDANEGAAIIRQLDRLTRAVGRVHRDLTVVADALAIYVKLWLAHTPPVIDTDRPKAERSAALRFAQFTESVTAKVASGRSVIGDLAPEQEAREREAIAPERGGREGDRS
jgi:hypothetical protein